MEIPPVGPRRTDWRTEGETEIQKDRHDHCYSYCFAGRWTKKSQKRKQRTINALFSNQTLSHKFGRGRVAVAVGIMIWSEVLSLCVWLKFSWWRTSWQSFSWSQNFALNITQISMSVPIQRPCSYRARAHTVPLAHITSPLGNGLLQSRPNFVAYLFKAIFNPQIHIPKCQFSSAVYVFVTETCELRISQLARARGPYTV